MAKPRTSFDWSIYADATFAGLSILIPFPLLDAIFEQIFRRRMPGAIARANGRSLSPEVKRLFTSAGCSPASLLLLPLWLVYQFLKRLSKKILYFLTVKEAVDTLGDYWHRAFLLDYMLRAGHLDSVERATVAREALSQTLKEMGESPLTSLARQVVRQTRHVLRSLFSVLRRGRSADSLQPEQETMRNTWARFREYLEAVAARYQAIYEKLQTEQL